MRITPGFHVLIFRLWTKSVDQALLVPIPGAFEVFCGHMQNFPLITDDREFEEAVEGSGGSRSSLARLCVNHIKCVVKSVVISPGAYSMRSIVSLLQARCQVDECFRQILIDEGIVSALISVACRFSSPPFTAHDDLFNMSFSIHYYLRIEYGHNIVTEALRAGLLRAFLQWGRMRPPKPQTLEQLGYILAALSRATVYLSVLRQLQASIEELKIPIDGRTFQRFPVSDKWQTFWSILQPRWALMEVYLKREKESDKDSCQNIQCLVIAQKSAFKRCSRCQAMYCSTSCQIHDWRHGDHCKTCKWKAVGASYIPRALVEHFEDLVYVHRYRRLLRSQYARRSVPPRTTPRRLLENEAHHFGR
ncbi:hypothetical protein K438DRAFT_1847734 [Mycena galopus ATCC 62051]|nr:hypothetical protein K438DRAFT_1847734 [Mycena galopus ATCC 62051]